MKVIIDAYGGDNAPLEIVKGAALAVKEYGVEVVLCGKEQELEELMAAEDISFNGITFVDAPLVMPVEADPTEILKAYDESSMAVGMKLLADGGGDAFVTAGSTGAAVVGATLIVKRIKGIRRPAIATVIPSSTGNYMLMDAGANAECRPEMLAQFGIMGSIYMERLMGIESPRVAMINIGAEENKGLDLQIDASKILREAPVNFIGNVEARELPLGGCDVAVTDGFTGNVVLKLTEGMGKMLMNELRAIFLKSFKTKLAASFLMSGVKAFRRRMDYTEYGGAPLMGICKPVIKAHGSSNAQAIKNAVRQAKMVHDKNVIAEITAALQNISKE